MGLDSECDLVLDAALDAARSAAPSPACGTASSASTSASTPRCVAEALARARLADRRHRGARAAEPRSLAPLPPPPDAADAELRAPEGGALDLTFLDGLVCDPERPGPDKLLETFVPEGLRRPVHRSLAGWALGAAARCSRSPRSGG